MIPAWKFQATIRYWRTRAPERPGGCRHPERARRAARRVEIDARPGLHQPKLNQERPVIPVVGFALDLAVVETRHIHVVEYERVAGRRNVPRGRGERAGMSPRRTRLEDTRRSFLDSGADLVLDNDPMRTPFD